MALVHGPSAHWYLDFPTEAPLCAGKDNVRHICPQALSVPSVAHDSLAEQPVLLLEESQDQTWPTQRWVMVRPRCLVSFPREPAALQICALGLGQKVQCMPTFVSGGKYPLRILRACSLWAVVGAVCHRFSSWPHRYCWVKYSAGE